MKVTHEFSFKDLRINIEKLKERIKKISLEFVDKIGEERSCCVACKYPRYTYAFEKNGFHYVQCRKCSSLYVKNPISKDHYGEYKSRILEVYREKEIKDKFMELDDKKIFDFEFNLNRLFSKDDNVCVGFSGLKYPDLMQNLKSKFPGFEFKEINLETESKHNMIILDNLIETLIEPDEYLKHIHSYLLDSGYLYITTRVGSGIDILMLWENSKVIPTEHLNLFTKEGVEFLIRDLFEIKYMSTPGILDVQMMLESIDDSLPPFLKYLKKHRGNEIVEDFQYFLQKNLLSSYLVALCQKK